MKIKCPSCANTGRVPDGKIPAAGANIRCPSCSFVFFVGGLQATNVVPESKPTQATSDAPLPEVIAEVTSSLPSDIVARMVGSANVVNAAQSDPGGVPEAAGSVSALGSAAASPPTAESKSDAAADPSISGRGGPSAKSSVNMPVAPAPDAGGFSGYGKAAGAPRSPAEPPSPTGGSAARVSHDSDAGTSAMGVLLGGDGGGRPRAVTGSAHTIAEPVATSEATVRSPTAAPHSAEMHQQGAEPAVDPNATSTVPGISGSSRAPRGAAFKVRNSVGITYDFPDLVNVRRWLEGRASHDELSISNDGGATWHAPAELAEVADVRPAGLRSSPLTENMRSARQTGSFRAIGSTDSGPSKGEASARAEAMIAPTQQSGLLSLASASAATEPAPAATASATDAATSLTEGMASAARGPQARRETEAAPHSKKARSAGKEENKPRRLKLLLAIGAAVAVIAGAGQFVVTKQEPGLQIPNSPAGRQVAWVLETIQGGTVTLSDATLQERFAPSVLEQVPLATLRQQLEYYDSWRSDYRPIRFARPPTPTLLEITVLTNGGDTGVIRIETEGEAPHRMVGLNFRGAD